MEWRIRDAMRLHMFPVGCNKNWNTLCNATNGTNKWTTLTTQVYSQFLWYSVFHYVSSTNRYKTANPVIPHYVFMDRLWSIRSKTELHVPYRFLTATHTWHSSCSSAKKTLLYLKLSNTMVIKIELHKHVQPFAQTTKSSPFVICKSGQRPVHTIRCSHYSCGCSGMFMAFSNIFLEFRQSCSSA
jgi:hypothetical protein